MGHSAIYLTIKYFEAFDAKPLVAVMIRGGVWKINHVECNNMRIARFVYFLRVCENRRDENNQIENVKLGVSTVERDRKERK